MARYRESGEQSKPIVIDTEDLIIALQNHDAEVEYFLDRSTGEVVFLPDEDIVEEHAELRSLIAKEAERFLFISPVPPSQAWQIMAGFIEQLPFDGKGEAKERLTRAVQRSQPFRRFKDELTWFPSVRESWFAYEYSRMLELAREWLTSMNVRSELTTRKSK